MMQRRSGVFDGGGADVSFRTRLHKRHEGRVKKVELELTIIIMLIGSIICEGPEVLVAL
jgi:hypothetical protein